jgi:hypothetical protein
MRRAVESFCSQRVYQWLELPPPRPGAMRMSRSDVFSGFAFRRMMLRVYLGMVCDGSTALRVQKILHVSEDSYSGAGRRTRHILSAACGFAVLWALGDSPWLAALVVGLAIAAMQATDTMHPPAGINALIMVTAHPAWTFILMPLATGALVLVAFSYVYRDAAQRLVGGRKG